jgi:hypothetical protein
LNRAALREGAAALKAAAMALAIAAGPDGQEETAEDRFARLGVAELEPRTFAGLKGCNEAAASCGPPMLPPVAAQLDRVFEELELTRKEQAALHAVLGVQAPPRWDEPGARDATPDRAVDHFPDILSVRLERALTELWQIRVTIEQHRAAADRLGAHS